MFGMMHGDRLNVKGDWRYDFRTTRDSSIRKDSDIGVLSSGSENSMQLMVWNYHDVDETAPDEVVHIQLKNLPVDKLQQFHYRIDNDHSNSYAKWKALGSPKEPTTSQYIALERAGELALYDSPVWKNTADGILDVEIRLPRHSVSFIDLRW